MPMTPKELQRFQARTQPQGDCIVWTGPPDRDGYGTFFLRRRARRVHRVAYWHEFGDIPTGMVINHRCRNRACVRADHLHLATLRENVFRDSENLAAKNAAKTECPRGHPYDRKYGGQRYCSICERAKTKRLRKKWRDEDTVGC